MKQVTVILAEFLSSAQSAEKPGRTAIAEYSAEGQLPDVACDVSYASS